MKELEFVGHRRVMPRPIGGIPNDVDIENFSQTGAR
jgi:hypothetical protein